MTASPPPVLPDERLAAERLDALAHVEGAPGVGLPRMLFVRSHNAGRSQMGAALRTDEVVQAADIVIRMGCGDACPVVPGRRYLDRPVADPEGAPIGVVRIIRDEIDAHITELLDSLPSR
ncbi:hypothetical protein [Streptomyces mirabilis]